MSYWQYVPGPDIPQAIYDRIANSVTESDIIIETEAGFGRGIHYLLESLKARNIHPKVYAFDTFGEEYPGSEYWNGHPPYTPWGEPFSHWVSRIGGSSRLIDQFAFYLRNSPAKEYLTDWAQFPNWTVAEEFKDDSVSWVIAGANRSTKAIDKEVEKWWPKLKIGGTIICNTTNRYTNNRLTMIKS